MTRDEMVKRIKDGRRYRRQCWPTGQFIFCDAGNTIRNQDWLAWNDGVINGPFYDSTPAKKQTDWLAVNEGEYPKRSNFEVSLKNADTLGAMCGYGEGATHLEAVRDALEKARRTDPHARYSPGTDQVVFSGGINM